MDPFLLGRSGDGLGFDQNRASAFFGPNVRERGWTQFARRAIRPVPSACRHLPMSQFH